MPTETSIHDLIPVRYEGEEPTVNARDLHTFLGVGKDFSTWIKDRIRQYNFVENQDFIVFTDFGENPQGGRPSKEYRLTLDMAKELAMIERTPKETLSWTPTAKGWPFAAVKDVPRASIKGGRPVRQLFWKEPLLERIDRELRLLGNARMQESQAVFSLTMQ